MVQRLKDLPQLLQAHPGRGSTLFHLGKLAAGRTPLEVAGREDAKGRELRAATSWSRLQGRRGQHTEARQVLAEACAAFTAGDTPDLRAAKALYTMA
jgi:hypothetical protein